MRKRLIATMVIVFVALSNPPPVAAGDPIAESGCAVVIANPRLSAERVRALVPKNFELDVDANGNTSVEFHAVRCERIIVDGGVVKRATWAAARVPLKSDPEGVRLNPADDPVFHFNTYTLWLASNSRELVELLRRDGNAGTRAVHVQDLSFTPPSVTGEFVFEAPSPTPTPFRIRATAQAPTLLLRQVTLRQWTAVQGGWMLIGDPDTIRNVRAAEARGTVSLRAPSELADVFCSTELSFVNDAGSVSFEEGSFSVSVVEKDSSPTEPLPPCS